MCLDKIRFMKKIKLSLVILLVVVSCLFLIVPSSSALYPHPEHPTNFPDWVRFLSPASLLVYLSIGGFNIYYQRKEGLLLNLFDSYSLFWNNVYLFSRTIIFYTYISFSIGLGAFHHLL